MDSIQIKTGNGSIKHYFAPANFDELTELQYIGAVEIMGRMTIDPSDQWRIPILLAKIDVNTIAELNAAQRAQLLVQFSWLFDPEKLPWKQKINKFSAKDFHKNIFQRSLLPSTVFYGPGDGLKHLTFGEFIACEQALDMLDSLPAGGQKDKCLDMLCGILYRSTAEDRKRQADKRAKFNEGEKDIYAKAFLQLNPVIKTAILMNYHGMKRRFPDLYRNLFSIKENKSNNGKKTPASLTWLNTIISLADADPVKVVDIENLSLHLVLKVLDEKILTNKKMKEEAERLRSKK